MNAAALERRDYVISETEHLLDGRVWPPEIAARLDYADVGQLRDALKKWQQYDTRAASLADRLLVARWDPDVAGARNGSNQHGGKKR